MQPPEKIFTSTLNDLETILDLYDIAIAYQKKVFHRHWQGFDKKMIESEIRENRQWKIVADNQIACIFAITFNDALIWKEKDKDPSIYIHRIVTNPSFRGNFYVKDIVKWAKEFGMKNGKKFIRMDTFGDNQKLIDYYTQCGFNFLGLTTMTKADNLPKHYEGASLSLFEIMIDSVV